MRRRKIFVEGPGSFWERPGWFTRAVSRAGLLRSDGCRAVLPHPDDSDVGSNTYWLRAGTPDRLRTHAEEIVEEVRRACGFDLSSWKRQMGWLRITVGRFFADGHSLVSWCSLLTARYSAAFRSRENHGLELTIRQQPSSIYRFTDPCSIPHTVSELGIPFEESWAFAKPEGAPWREMRWNRVTVPRSISVPFYNVDYSYREEWYCLARPGTEDTYRLLRGETPAVDKSAYQLANRIMRVRKTVLLGLFKMTYQMMTGNWLVSFTVLEFEPTSGLVISIRNGRMPLAAAALCWAKVERDEMAALIRAA